MSRSYVALKLIIPLLALGTIILFSKTHPASVLKNITWLVVKTIAETVTPAVETIKGEPAVDNGRLEAALFEIEELRLRIAELEKALRFKEKSHLNLFGARVVLYAKELGHEYLIIDAGRNDGIREGNIVVSPERIFVGTVKSAEESFSKVSLASNSGETFEVEILPLKISAIAKGRGARTFSLELVPQDTPLKRGDLVAVTGSQPFLLGEIVYGKIVSNKSFQEVGAVLTINPRILKDVFVLNSSK